MYIGVLIALMSELDNVCDFLSMLLVSACFNLHVCVT